MPKKFTQEEVSQYFKEQGYELLSEYTGRYGKVKVRNSKGEEYTVTPGKFKSGQRPDRDRRKFTQEHVANYFKEQGYTLLSEYERITSKLRVRNKYGDEYLVNFSDFRKGKRPERRNFKLTQEEVAQYFIEHGYTLLSEYKNSGEKIKIRNAEGCLFDVRWSDFKRGKRPDRDVRGIASKRRVPIAKVNSIFSEAGYVLIGEYTSSNNKVKVLCPNNHVWNVSLNNFRRGRRCPECNSNIVGGMSNGERMVWTILQGNSDILSNIDREVSVRIAGDLHRFDFVLTYDKQQYVIEYDGKQHYDSNLLYARPKRIDKQKDVYCQVNGITIVRIPYTVNTIPEVTCYIQKRTGIPLVAPHTIYSTTIQEVVDYYLEHTIEETMDKFSISNTTVTKYFSLVHGISKRKFIKRKEMVAEYYLTHSREETMALFGVSKTTVTRCFTSVHGMPKAEYTKNWCNTIEIAEYYLTHHLRDTSTRFSVGGNTVVGSFKQVFGMSKRDYKRQE